MPLCSAPGKGFPGMDFNAWRRIKALQQRESARWLSDGVKNHSLAAAISQLNCCGILLCHPSSSAGVSVGPGAVFSSQFSQWCGPTGASPAREHSSAWGQHNVPSFYRFYWLCWTSVAGSGCIYEAANSFTPINRTERFTPDKKPPSSTS